MFHNFEADNNCGEFLKGRKKAHPYASSTRLYLAIMLFRKDARNKQQISLHSVSNCLHSSDRCAISQLLQEKKLTVCPACQLALFSALEVLAPLWMI